MKIAICDDEEVIRNSIAEILRLHYPDTSIALFSSSEELLDSEEVFSIYLLDIEMSGLSGMELAKCIRKKTVRRTPTPVIIFRTVDLPAPFFPIIATDSPLRIVKLTPSRAL